MIIIKKNSINEIAVTLFEKKISDTDIYLFVFTNKVSNQSYSCLAVDRSPSSRYNAFCITEISGGTPDPTQAEIKLILDGQYEYNIYESPSGSLSPAGLNNVEFGRMLVIETRTGPATYSTNPKLTVYNKNQN